MTLDAIRPFPDAPFPYDQCYNSPLMNASGTWHPELPEIFPDALDGLGAIVLKTATRFARAGNSQPRTVDLGAIGMLNSIGLQNPGLESVLAFALPTALKWQRPVWLSLSADSPEDWSAMAECLSHHPLMASVSAVELNTSCPNVDHTSGFSAAFFNDSVSGVKFFRQAFKALPILAKLSPAEFGLAGMMAMAEAALEAGATGITAINTMIGLAVDVPSSAPILARKTGGYSGPGIFPIALASVYRLRERFATVPLVGCGGVRAREDVLAMQAAGATLVQVGCATFVHPTLFKTLHDTQLESFDAGINR
ncbi:MAG: hypothetical protein VKK59_07650 [Vampirovibrionales bacterium]|nr:hypothetical protein [Vampirovibrionales bacterium]